ncbi:MAG: SRPBCC family protein, partial [Gemmatimonadaceae bacterium]
LTSCAVRPSSVAGRMRRAPRNPFHGALVMRWVIIVVGGLVALVAIVALIGALLPQSHVASRARSYPHAPERVFAAISDVRSYPRWRPGVREVTLLAEQPLRWREDGTNGKVEFELVANDPPRRQVTRIASENLPFGGRWEYDVARDGEGARLTITEHGDVYNPIFRFMARFIFGYRKTMEDYQAALDAYLAREPKAP